MPFSSKAVANEILRLGKRDGKEISPMKMLKMVYYAHGWHLAITGRPLINEQIEAWKYGPVVRSLFHEFKIYGNTPIAEPVSTMNIQRMDGGRWMFDVSVPYLEGSPNEPVESVNAAKAVIAKVWEQYGPYSAIKLSNMTHEPGGPWDLTVKRYNGEPPKGTDIRQSVISRHFKRAMERHLDGTAGI